MKLKKNRKFLVMLSIVLTLVIGASATFAWVTSKTQLENRFKNEGFALSNGLVAIEPEDPEEFKLTIGEKTDKHVSVFNTGESGMLCRVTFEELVKLLSSTNTVEYKAANTAGTGQIPIPFNNSAAALADWAAVAAPITVTPALPVGVTLYMKDVNGSPQFKAKVDNASSSTGDQLVKFDGKAAVDASGVVTAITDAAVTYGYYTEGIPKYSSWNDAANYQDTAWLAKKASPTVTVAGKPAACNNSLVDPDISFLYETGTVTASPTANKWYYNAADGYFYWIGVLDGGQATDNLLAQVALSGSAIQAIWQKYEYSLVICVEGLQANKDALSATDTATGDAAGWKLPAGALLTALEAAITAFYA